MPTRPGNDHGNPQPTVEVTDASQCGRVPTILDNRSGNTVLSALERLVPCAVRLDVATGTFDIGSLMAVDGLRQELERNRRLTGDETARRTWVETHSLTHPRHQREQAEEALDTALLRAVCRRTGAYGN